VKIESIDRENRRLSLALAGAARAAGEEEATLEEFRRNAADTSVGMGTLGDMLTAAKKNKKK